MKIDKSLQSGSTTLLVLTMLEKKDMYGYEMIEALERRSNNVFTLKAGTLYPILHSLEQKGVIAAYEDETEGGRQRRYYRITDSGRSVLEEKKKEWEVYSGAVNRVLSGAFDAGPLLEGIAHLLGNAGDHLLRPAEFMPVKQKSVHHAGNAV